MSKIQDYIDLQIREDFKTTRSSLTILESLLLGLPIEVENKEYLLGGDNELCLVAYSDKDELCLLKLDISLKDFINFCSKITSEERVVISANNVLNRGKSKNENN